MAYSTAFFLKEPQTEPQPAGTYSSEKKIKKDSKDTLVYVTFTFNKSVYDSKNGKKYLRLKYSTGEKINPKYWDFEAYRAKQTRYFPYAEFNTRLDRFKNSIEDIYRNMLNDGIEPTIERIRERLNITYGRGNRTAPINLFSFIDEYLYKAKITEGTKKKYTATLNHLKKFAEFKNIHFSFNDVDLELYREFEDYLRKEQKQNENTVGKYLKIFKHFMNEAYEAGHHVNQKYKSKRFTTASEETDKIYLTLSDLDKLYKHNYERKSLERVRDLFLIGCFTGLRYSDFTQINENSLYQNDQGEFLKVVAQKTKQQLVIPLHPIVKAILTKYNNHLPTDISNQKMNEYLKEMGEQAGITYKVSISKSKAGVRYSESIEKYKLISSHTARRSFATNAYLAGEEPISIMAITGHTSTKTFLQYIKMDAEDNAIKMQGGAFFSGTALKVV